MLTHIKAIFLTLLLLAAVPAIADEASAIKVVTEELHDQGYAVEAIKRTFWGRIRILAEKDDLDREVILNPYTGEILRDLIRRHREETTSGGSGGTSPAVTNSDVGDSNESTEGSDDSSETDNSGGSESSDTSSQSDSSESSDSSDDGGTDD